ncbi:uncharacterized protein MYCFIDRAFT_207505 [Pseudocercospora fijiensis CIRAD86]|uniref:Uncharacterized protein n=1 Tax=Pseudocercospora fijiensis (strain CIRAD86) TaxID=383855 RepID=M3B758_PSEFD|nr:uncharacterized protein MYCFIDRAFT_207505 [Pseudocercospora fijiensis CIRAD86]EME85163.1 hypothetical protein MYCFIDRAFT_207505 [Pseudocercospora fijiensis CIRAD86]
MIFAKIRTACNWAEYYYRYLFGLDGIVGKRFLTFYKVCALFQKEPTPIGRNSRRRTRRLFHAETLRDWMRGLDVGNLSLCGCEFSCPEGRHGSAGYFYRLLPELRLVALMTSVVQSL